MDGLGIPIFGGFIGLVALLVCSSNPRLKRFALAACVSPFIASIVFLIGLFIIADMNPAVEYGAQYTPTGREHDPTALNYGAWLGSTILTFSVSAIVCFRAQQIGAGILRRMHPGSMQESRFNR